jgi:hypothetical protein
MNEKLFSKSVKKQLSKEYDEDLLKSLDNKKNLYQPLKEFLTDKSGNTHSVREFTKPVYFPVNLKNALKGEYSRVFDLYKEAIEIHNEFIAGTRSPNDAFEWFNTSVVVNLIQNIEQVFSDIGKKIAYKKRRRSAYEAQKFLFENVLSPLDKFTWQVDCKLDLFFQHGIDLLCQSYLSEFVKNGFQFNSTLLTGSFTINWQSFCHTPKEAHVIQEQMKLYNVADYVLMENTIRDIASKIQTTVLYEPSIKEQVLFDIFELIPLYIKSWDASRSKIVINESITIFIFLDFGFPSFVIGTAEDRPELLKASTLRFSWGVNHSLRSEGKRDCCIPELEVLGDCVLEKLYETLISLYAIRKPENTILINEELVEYSKVSESQQLTDFTEQYHQILSSKMEDNSLTISESKSVVPSMSMSVFFKFMKTNFDCNVDEGKGSEMKIWRVGHNIYTLGRHKKDPQIHSFLIKKIIKRMGISRTKWLEVLSKF